MAVRDEKKFFAGLLEWKDRTGADLKADLEAATTMVEPSLRGCRIVNAILR